VRKQLAPYGERMTRALDKFIDEYEIRNRWINVGPTRAYLRKGPLYVNGQLWPATVTLANMIVRDSRQRQGCARHVLQWMEGLKGHTIKEKPIQLIYVENVLNERMLAILIRHHWYPVEKTEFPCFYKIL